MKKYIFLDIDGVINHDDWYYENRVVKKNFKCGDFDPRCIELLNQLEGVEVVISSSWGKDADKPLVDLGLKLPIVGYTDHVSLNYDWLCRGNEIEKWLIENENSGTKYGASHSQYVIFDDDKDFLLEQKDNFVWVDRRHGLTQGHINKAKEILS